MKRTMQGALVLVALALAGAAAADVAPMDRKAYEAALDKVEAQHEADRKLCDRMKKGNARDVCVAQADGRKQALEAKLAAELQPGAEATQDAKNAVAEANYRVARAKCKALKDSAEDRCVKEAKAAREAAIRQAKVEKVQETGGPFATGAQRKAGSS